MNLADLSLAAGLAGSGTPRGFYSGRQTRMEKMWLRRLNHWPKNPPQDILDELVKIQCVFVDQFSPGFTLALDAIGEQLPDIPRHKACAR